LPGAHRFEAAGLEGTFVLRNEQTGCVRTTDATLADEPFSPKSTFKLPNTLIGLETGVITGESHLWRWQGEPRALKEWQADLDLGGALRVSCVPCFQDVARRVGDARMREALRAFDYGNQDTAPAIDQFWLSGALRITPRQQVEFVHRMLTGQLPVKREHVDTLWRLLEIERGEGLVFSGKTGFGDQGDRVIGWLVGRVERGADRFAYATLVRSRVGADRATEGPRLMPLRKPLTRALLADAGVLAPP
jgi:beta-lactamase class D